MTSSREHAFVNFPMFGDDSLLQIATVTSGVHEGKNVCILIEFSDGKCICDMGLDEPMEIIDIDEMRLWISVDSITIIDGVVTNIVRSERV